MSVTTGRRALLVSAAAALAAGSAGIALGYDHTGASASVPSGIPLVGARDWSWSFSSGGSAGDVIQVRSRHCPNSHPRKLGSFSYSSTRIVNGKVEHHSSQGSICAK
jgi:hypothetical protein